MNESQRNLFEERILSLAKGLEYPRTPDLTGSVIRRLRASASPRLGPRWLAWSLVVLLLLCSSLLLIPEARAAILDFIQIGAVRIFRIEPTSVVPTSEQFPVTATPVPQALIPMLENMAGEMTLEQAQQTVAYPLLLPSYPSTLGLPDRVFVQDADGDMTVLVWTDPQQPDQVLMSLHFLPAGSWAIKKMAPQSIQETTVNGQPAIWAIGPYPMLLSNGNMQFLRMVDGHVLIWTEGDITYRLETDLSLDEAIRVAESLHPIR
jgi:hypothetical protein